MSRSAQTILLIMMLVLMPDTAFAAEEEVSVSEIIELASKLSGKRLTVEGELVGDYGFRDDGWMWTQLNGDAYVHRPLREEGSPVGANLGIGVRMPLEMAEGLDPPGGYRNRGPLVRVTGIWKYHDPSRQGESYLEVQILIVREPGRKLYEQVNWTAIILGILLLAGAGLVALHTSRDD